MPTQTPVTPPDTTAATPAQTAPPRSAGLALLGVILMGAGALWLLAALGVEVPVTLVTPLVLVALGVAVTVSALRGEDHPALGFAVFVGVWLAIFALLTAVTSVPLTGAVGDVDITPATVTDLDDGYRLFAGTQRVDLRGLELEAGTTEVVVSTVLGEIDVRVPEGVAVRIEASAAAGGVDLYGTAIDGVGIDRTDETDGWSSAEHRLDLDLRVGLGQVRVRTD